MEVTFWGTRGSLAAPGPDTARYGGNTSCVEVNGDEGTSLVLDAGTGIRPLGGKFAGSSARVDLLLTHLHMDHLQGLGFFAPIYAPGREVHIWGPASATLGLPARLARYMSPPLFPVRLKDLPSRLTVHEVPCGRFDIGEFEIDSALICHPGPTVGYRIHGRQRTLAYMPDHEPSLGVGGPLRDNGWTSGLSLASDVDLLIHDAQYDDDEYRTRMGWGHSTMKRAIEFAGLARARQLVFFHHDPAHDDGTLDHMVSRVLDSEQPAIAVSAAKEGTTVAF